MDFKKVLGLVPVLGAAFREGETKSEYDLATGGIAAIATMPDIPGWARAVGIGLIVAAYIWARTSKKTSAAAAAAVPAAGAAAMLLALFLPAILLGGCTAALERDALARVGDVGPRIAADIRPTDAGGEARKTEFLRLCEECRRLGQGK